MSERHVLEIKLFDAVNANNFDNVKKYIGMGADTDDIGVGGRMIFDCSTSYEMDRLLIESGVDVNVMDSMDNTAFYKAYMSGNFRLVKLLIKHDVFIGDEDLEYFPLDYKKCYNLDSEACSGAANLYRSAREEYLDVIKHEVHEYLCSDVTGIVMQFII